MYCSNNNASWMVFMSIKNIPSGKIISSKTVRQIRLCKWGLRIQVLMCIRQTEQTSTTNIYVYAAGLLI